MQFRTLQERLRKTLQARIQAGTLSGLELARQTGFRQAHICNFLNSKRGLSLDGMDRVLAVQQLSIFDLLKSDEVNRHATSIAPGEGDFENVVLVDAVAAGQPTITSERVKDILKFKKSFLRRLRPGLQDPREKWRRFVLLKVSAHDGMSMYPRLLPGAIVLLDRHYNSLLPYRRKERNMYAVRHREGCIIRYLEVAGQNLILRPHNDAYPLAVLAPDKDTALSHYIVGRVCYVSFES